MQVLSLVLQRIRCVHLTNVHTVVVIHTHECKRMDVHLSTTISQTSVARMGILTYYNNITILAFIIHIFLNKMQLCVTGNSMVHSVYNVCLKSVIQ